ncbi:centromere protein X [Parasitella parasitica]|nr:centromere protein X [Parasitella parasitica]
MDTDEAFLNPDTVLSIFKSSFKNKNSKINKEALQLSCEFLRLFTIEAVHRASEEQDNLNKSALEEQGSSNQRKKLELENLERILPQLLLDF